MRGYTPLMPLRRKVLHALISALLLALAQGAFAQVTRVVIFPFETDANSRAYQLGLTAAIQRSVNQIPNVYAPPVGDAALVANKAATAGQDAFELAGRLFDATALVTGRVTAGGGGVRASIVVDIAGGSQTFEVEGATPVALATAAAEAVARAVAPNASSAALQAVAAAAAQTPSLPSLAVTGLAASGLPGAGTTELDAAMQIDPDSAWVTVEFGRIRAVNGDLAGAAELAQQAAAMAPADADIQATAGVLLASAGRDQAAITAFTAALQVNPAHAVALAGRASLAANNSDALADLQAAVAAYPRFVDAQVRLGALQPDPTRAVQLLIRAEQYLPDSVALKSNVLATLLEAGDESGALAYLRQSVQDPLAASPGLYALARNLPLSQITGARALIADGRQLYPDSLDLLAAQADLLLKTGDTAGAIDLLAPAYEANPGSLAVGGLLAVAMARQGDIAGARGVYAAQRGEGANANRGLAELYLAAGRAAAALELLGPLVAADPNDADLHAMHGAALARMGRLDEGVQALERAIALVPGHSGAQRALSLIEQQRELTVAAGGQQLAFNEDAGAAFQQGLYALDVGDAQAAVEAFGRSRALQDNGLNAFYQGYAYQLAGNSRLAIGAYNVALEQFPGSDIILNNMGFAQYDVGRFDLALDYLRQAIASNPENARAHLNLGMVYFGMQFYEQAIAPLQEAERLEPGLADTTQELIAAARERLANQ